MSLDRLRRILGEENSPVGLLIDRRYQILQPIARGGMGEVFLARDVQLDRRAAMKILLPRFLAPSCADSFRDEIGAMAKLDHPGVVPVYHVGECADNRWYYTMPYIEGRTLRQRIAAGEPREPLLRALIGVCDVIQHAHDRGVLHRDLKPSNIMVDQGGRVFVLDWGVARIRDVARQTSAPSFRPPGATGNVFGTAGYMSPEQARGDLTGIGRRSDVYSLGAILSAILAGGPANPALATVCAKAMSAAPEDRFSSAKELASRLRTG